MKLDRNLVRSHIKELLVTSAAIGSTPLGVVAAGKANGPMASVLSLIGALVIIGTMVVFIIAILPTGSEVKVGDICWIGWPPERSDIFTRQGDTVLTASELILLPHIQGFSRIAVWTEKPSPPDCIIESLIHSPHMIEQMRFFSKPSFGAITVYDLKPPKVIEVKLPSASEFDSWRKS